MTCRPSRFRLTARLMRGIAAVSLVSTVSLTARAELPPGNPVQQWNKIAEDTVVGSGAFQNEGLIYMAYVSAAVYDALVALEEGYEPYGHPIAAPPGASTDAAVIEAAYATLRHYFPAQASSLDAWHDEALGVIPDGPAKLKGLATGRTAAKGIIELRRHDGRLTPIAVSSAFPTKEPGPGVWRLTPPSFAAPQTPWVGSVQPFVLNDVDQFRPPAPPALTSQRWVDDRNEVWVYGTISSGTRTAQQTAIARFWTANVIRQYNRVGRDLSTTRALDLVQTARLLAMINVVGADAQISVMHWKYEFLFWRPVTAIDPFAVTNDGFGPVPGFVDGNPATPEEVGWRPLVATPNHPEYPGAHGSITSAIAEVLTVFFGTDQIDVDIHGFDATGPAGNLNATRHFDTAAQLRAEIVNARIWAGFHYRGSSEAGVDLGRDVAAYDLANAFRPVQER
jgi:VCPO second helical-bundle domain